METRPLNPVLEFMQHLWALDHALRSRSKRMEAQLGVTAPQRLAIRILGDFPGLTPSELAATLHLHRSTLTGVLKRLEEQGAVERRVNPEDLRSAALFLTPHGALLNTLREGTVESAVHAVTAAMGEGDTDSFLRVLNALVTQLDAPTRVASSRGRGRQASRSRAGRGRP